MSLLVLGIENLVFCLFLIALAVAKSASKDKMVRAAVKDLSGIAILYLMVLGQLGFLTHLNFFTFPLFSWFAGLTACIFLGGIFLFVYGYTGKAKNEGMPRAAKWPRNKLMCGAATLFLLQLGTYFYRDLSIQVQLTQLQSRENAIAASLMPARVPDADNAACFYTKAFQLLEKDTPAQKTAFDGWTDALNDQESQDKFAPQSEEVRAYFDSHAAIIDRLHQAADRPACFFERDYGAPEFLSLSPDPHDIIRPLSRLLALDARVKVAQGDLRGALRDCRTLRVMSRHILNAPSMMSFLIGSAVNDIFQNSLEYVLNSQLPTLAELTDSNIEDDYNFRLAHQHALRVEKASTVANGLCIIAMGQLPAAITNDPTLHASAFGKIFGSVYRVLFFESDLNYYERKLQFLWETAQKPYWKTKDKSPLQDASFFSRRHPIGINIFFGPDTFSMLAQSAARTESQYYLMKTAVAVYKFRADKNAWPETLDALVPDYLESVPEDPFDRKPVKKMKTDEKIILYSVGPDETDDGGAPYDTHTKNGDYIFTIKTSRHEEKSK